jgi:Fe-S cluster biogenesis protein NfuA
LFEIDGISRAFVSGDVIVVAKNGDIEWKELANTIGAVIREQIKSGKELIVRDDSPSQTKEAAIRHQVEELFRKQLNPGLASHGGFVKLEDVKGSVVYLSMGGGCQGCGAAKMTLKMGIERTVFGQVPQVTEVVDVTDHAAGQNPYYDKAPDAE